MNPLQTPSAVVRSLARHIRTLLPAALFAATAIMPFVLIAAIVPEPLALPALSLAAIAAAAIVAAAAWGLGTRRDAERVTAWDIAGAFTLIGCAAAMLTQTEYAVEYLAGTRNK